MCLILYVSLFAEFPREGQDRSPQPSPESRLFRHLSMCFCKYANLEKIALVKFFFFFLRLASDAKLKFAMISAATLSV